MTGDRRLVALGLVTFLGACAALITGLVVFGAPVRTQVGRPIAEVASTTADGASTATLDARDTASWRGFSFALGRVVPEGPAADLLVQRHMIRAPRGAVDLGVAQLDQASVPEDAVWSEDAMKRWYDYGYLTHTLYTKGHVYAVKAEDGVVYIQVESYACAPEGSGCLSLRYQRAGATSPNHVTKDANPRP